VNYKEAFIATIKEIIQTALISLGIFLFVYVFLVQPHRVQGVSMVSSFENGELLLTEKISYKVSNIQRGDIVVFEAPVDRKADFIKRIIALPGENVEIKESKVFINGSQLAESYIFSPTEGAINITLERDEFFVLGDNRLASSDSRSFGSIKRKSIKGKVWLVYWPIFRSNNYDGARFISHANYSIPD